MDEIGNQRTAEPISTSTSTRADTMALIADLNDNALQELASFARFLAGYNTHEAEEIMETIARNERAMADRRRKDRETRIQNLSLSEKRVWNRVQRGREKARQRPRTDFTLDEADLLLELSAGGPQLAVDAFYLGYEKGFLAAAKG